MVHQAVTYSKMVQGEKNLTTVFTTFLQSVQNNIISGRGKKGGSIPNSSDINKFQISKDSNIKTNEPMKAVGENTGN